MTTPLPNIPTPYYLIDEEKIEKNLQALAHVKQQTGCKILLATKAFACFNTYPLIAKYLDGTTNSSVNEAKLSKETFGKETHIYSPAYKQADVDQLTHLVDHIVFNSLNQLNRYQHQVPATTQIGIRLNPEHIEVSNPLYSPCVPGSRFGILAQDIELAQLTTINGVHIHALCQNNGDSLIRLIQATSNKFDQLLNYPNIKWVNFGGGHMIPSSNYNKTSICQAINDFQATYNVQVILEPGEAVVYQAGQLVCSVIDIVHNTLDIAILDTSATAHMPDVIEMPYRPHIKDSFKPNQKKYTYRLAGNTCLSGDVIGEYSFDQPLQPGQPLIFEDMAQYTIVKNTLFNGIQLPSIVIKQLNSNNYHITNFDYSVFKQRLGH